ncbi:uncharacterized protein LOC110456070 [Mizuhopecten yessoensis]|uniref:Uncharacterized protein n=1 Tax=Mizuhopecten yessoensis TaxID=6573 RepID=A0A210R6V1_MIZYE|nr:uncharacterized protein LOC110456070 [Mizuhopecten yessoensis]OWF56787.1 hypothetical protein KP79_PYT19896 [Mizuhopecten yessoensis]
MACSGINEHHEARRRQNQAERKALVKMMLLKERDNGLDACQLIQPPPSSYEAEVTHLRKLGSPPGMTGVGHDPLSTDRQRREDLRQQQIVEYSAKLPKRFNSIDYKSQW